MASVVPEGSQYDDRQYVDQITKLLARVYEFFRSYDVVSFDETTLQELLSASNEHEFMKGLDVILQELFGTEKTATFCFGILQQLDSSLVPCQALVLTSTCKLALQIEMSMRSLSGHLGLKVHACLGWTSVQEDQRILQSGVHVVVATPDRVLDMLKRKSHFPDHMEMFVFNEADPMVSSRGFVDQILEIFQLLPSVIHPEARVEKTRKFMDKHDHSANSPRRWEKRSQSRKSLLQKLMYPRKCKWVLFQPPCLQKPLLR